MFEKLRKQIMLLTVIVIVMAFDYLYYAVAYAQNGTSIANPPTLVILFAFLGIIARNLLPVIQKIRETPPGEHFKWDHTYTATLTFTILLAGVALFTIGPTLPVATGFGAISIAFLAGWGSQDVINQLAATAGAPARRPATP